MSQTPQSEVPQGMHRITKTELVWPGQYDEHGNLREVPRVSLLFQVIETINESRATREARHGRTLSLFDVYEGTEGDTLEEGWRNNLMRYAMSAFSKYKQPAWGYMRGWGQGQ